jgi:hypothetical protein
MANGDAAAAAGLTVFLSTQDLRLGYDNDNVRGDELAAHLISGTHPASAITSGTLDIARVPNIPTSKLTGTVTNTVDNGYTRATDLIGGTISNSAGTIALNSSGIIQCSSVQSTGNINVSSGTITASSTVTGSGGIIDPGAYGRNTAGFTPRQLYIGTNGYYGYSSSSKTTKQNIKDATVDIQAVYALRIVNYRYKDAVKLHGKDAPVEIGLIAEDLVEAGLSQFVFFDDDKPAGIHYEKLCLALIPAIQDLDARLTALETKN